MTQTASVNPSFNIVAQRGRTLAQILIPILFAAILLPLIGGIYLALFEPAPDAPPAGIGVALLLIGAIAPLVVTWGLLSVAVVLREYEQGRYFSLRASAHVQRVGAAALVALLFDAIVAPVASAALRGNPGWAAFNPDVFDVCVLSFASFTLIIGGVLENAGKRLKAENDEIV